MVENFFLGCKFLKTRIQRIKRRLVTFGPVSDRRRRVLIVSGERTSRGTHAPLVLETHDSRTTRPLKHRTHRRTHKHPTHILQLHTPRTQTHTHHTETPITLSHTQIQTHIPTHTSYVPHTYPQGHKDTNISHTHTETHRDKYIHVHRYRKTHKSHTQRHTSFVTHILHIYTHRHIHVTHITHRDISHTHIYHTHIIHIHITHKHIS